MHGCESARVRIKQNTEFLTEPAAGMNAKSPVQQMALKGTIMRDIRPTQANLSGHKGVGETQHAFRHTKPRPG